MPTACDNTGTYPTEYETAAPESRTLPVFRARFVEFKIKVRGPA